MKALVDNQTRIDSRSSRCVIPLPTIVRPPLTRRWPMTRSCIRDWRIRNYGEHYNTQRSRPRTRGNTSQAEWMKTPRWNTELRASSKVVIPKIYSYQINKSRGGDTHLHMSTLYIYTEKTVPSLVSNSSSAIFYWQNNRSQFFLFFLLLFCKTRKTNKYPLGLIMKKNSLKSRITEISIFTTHSVSLSTTFPNVPCCRGNRLATRRDPRTLSL